MLVSIWIIYIIIKIKLPDPAGMAEWSKSLISQIQVDNNVT